MEKDIIYRICLPMTPGYDFTVGKNGVISIQTDIQQVDSNNGKLFYIVNFDNNTKIQLDATLQGFIIYTKQGKIL